MLSILIAAAALFQAATQAQAPVITSLKVMPRQPVVTARDTIRLQAQALDANGAVGPGARIRFVTAGFANAGQVDSAGLVSTASIGTLPISVIASVPGGRPITERIEVKILPGPPMAATITPAPGRIVVGQRIRLGAMLRTAT